VLPFGLSSAPYVFTKVLKPLKKHWRIQGLYIAIFLDDGWVFVRARESCPIKARDVICSMGAHPSIGLAGYNLEFCVRLFGNCRKKNC